MYWNANHTTTLRSIAGRVNDYRIGDSNRIKPRPSNYKHNGVFSYGRNGYVKSERQFVLDRFRYQTGYTRFQVSDQAIWAKYVRLTGGVAKVARAVLKVLDTKYTTDTVILTSGMDMKNWKDLGLKYLGCGATRTIFDLGDGFVLKVAKDRHGGQMNGMKSNSREAKTWSMVANSADAVVFAGVVAASPDGSWIVQEKVNTTTPTLGQRQAITRRIAKKYRITDLHSANFGMRADGQPVVLDYASA